MDELKFLSEEEFSLMESLDEKYFAGMLNEEDSKLFLELTARVEDTEKAYIDLCEKAEKTPEEEKLCSDCYDNLVMCYGLAYKYKSDAYLLHEYERYSSFEDHNPLTLVALDAIKNALDKRSLTKRKIN